MITQDHGFILSWISCRKWLGLSRSLGDVILFVIMCVFLYPLDGSKIPDFYWLFQIAHCELRFSISFWLNFVHVFVCAALSEISST